VGNAEDEAMAENIAAERKRAPGDIYLIEVGNYHARMTIGAPWDESKKWMAGFLASREPGGGHPGHAQPSRHHLGLRPANAQG
jgi:hypothetical protein